MRSTRSACAPTGGCCSSTPTKTACTRSSWRTGARWSPSSTDPAAGRDAQILEEHAFALELAAAEVPVVAPLVLQASDGDGLQLLGEPPTLACWHAGGERAPLLGVTAAAPGVSPNSSNPTPCCGWAFIGRLHAVGRRQPFEHRHRMDPRARRRRRASIACRPWTC
jgi:hypothetical protein